MTILLVPKTDMNVLRTTHLVLFWMRFFLCFGLAIGLVQDTNEDGSRVPTTIYQFNFNVLHHGRPSELEQVRQEQPQDVPIQE